MNTAPSKPLPQAEERDLKLVKDKLEHTLNMLDVYGVSGAIAVCLFPDGSTYLTAGGTCMDLHGATMGLYTGLTGIRDLAKERGDDGLLAVINEAVHALAAVVLRGKDNGEVH